ncbi:hypothetical protein WICMUC_002942 [Wickerhamomyces mucosus]|uniref:RhoGAP-domain-containing protein n=1 Tax=Wickerhamomyces mucosus TaxID=1378264 RepID=A0A9P8PNW0_9ASCO|nr:hypothetical protein WICMUC_002942 [Wickerhamomyces mucosus]
MSRYGDTLGSDFNISGSITSPKPYQRHRQLQSQNLQKKTHRHNESNGSILQDSPRSYHQIHDTTRDQQLLGSPHSTNSPNHYHDNSLVRNGSKHSHISYLKFIPPTPDKKNLQHSPPSFKLGPKNKNNNDNNNNNSTTNNTNPNQLRINNSSNYSTSICASCNKPITTKSVKALGKRYHTECFVCYDCGDLILSKYFPFETQSGEKIPLCEEHFYKRRGLICCVCQSYLKGTHYTVFGRKYCADHFCCKICSKKFDTVEDFFNHEDNIYCHYHFSKFFVDRCEGCECSILKQYVEIFRGGKNQKWHVECYMIHKLWNIAITPNSIGITTTFPKIEPTEENLKNSKDLNPSPDELLTIESKSNEKINEIWSILFKFEGDTATCISDMLQSATINDHERALETTTRLVLKISCLFNALESLHRIGIDSNQGIVSTTVLPETISFQSLKREPRNLSAKIMIYLSILRNGKKLNNDDVSNQDLLLSAATGLAHYLKLLIRYGLYNSLQFDKTSHATNALDKFLREISQHETIPSNPFNSLNVPTNASEHCYHCQKNIESECIQYKDFRWHVECLQCSKCFKNLQAYGGIADASLNPHNKEILCAQCAVEFPEAKSGFKYVSKLSQLIYLLKIAIVRSKAALDNEKKALSIAENSKSEENEKKFMKTLNDIKRLKSTRQNTSITNNDNNNNNQNIRKSIIVESSDLSKVDISSNDQKDNDFFSVPKQKITVEDEPLNQPTLSKNSFNRATNFINTQKVLTLDDIPRIVAAEHARELRPNTYKFHNPHQDQQISKGIKSKSNSLIRGAPSIQASIEASTKEASDVKYYSQLNDNEKFILTHISAILLKQLATKNDINIELDVMKLVDLKKQPTFWDKLKNIGSDSQRKASNINTKVFGIELKDLTSKSGVESSQSNGPTKVRIPMVIEDVLSTLYQKDMSIEGIFRKNGNLKTLKELINQIDSNPSKVPTLLNENAIQLSALLKKFLRELPTPLLTFRLYNLWIQSQRIKDSLKKKLLIELSYSLLPKTHRDLAEVLLFFFMWASSFSHLDDQNGSKMDIHNLATVLSPNILYSEPTDITRPSNGDKNPAKTYYDTFNENEGENYYLAIEAVDYLITHNEELTIVPVYLIEILKLLKVDEEKSLDQLNSKELFTRIEIILKENPSILSNIGVEIKQNNGNDVIFEEENISTNPIEMAIVN